MAFKPLALLIALPLLCFAKAGYVEPWGKDEMLVKRPLNSLDDPSPPTKFIGRFAEGLVLFHQNVISPVDGPRSHFRPTSARYTLLAMRRYGVMKGALMGFDRLIRENREEWVYPKVIVGKTQYKYDPTY